MSLPPPPVPNFQRKEDADHLKLLAIFHFIGTVLGVFTIIVLMRDSVREVYEQ